MAIVASLGGGYTNQKFPLSDPAPGPPAVDSGGLSADGYRGGGVAHTGAAPGHEQGTARTHMYPHQYLADA